MPFNQYVIEKSSLIILIQSNTIKLLGCLTSWEELLTDLKGWVAHQLHGFNLEFSSKVNTIEISIGWRMGKIALIANNETWFDYEAA